MVNFLLGLCVVFIAAAPRVLAQTAANSDFNPFPQMEQDTGGNSDQTDSPASNEDNTDWPPANADSKGGYD